MADLDYLIAEFQESVTPQLVRRDLELPRIERKANVVIGMRRSGKTYLLHQQMEDLIAAGVDKRDMLYANFEDDRLQPSEPGLLSDLLEAFFRSNPSAREREAHLFFDEMQVVPDWARFVRRVLDTERVRVCVSGSSAKMLHAEVATELRGRGFATEVFPYSFAESLRAAGIAAPQSLPPGPKLRSELEARFGRYLSDGGFPEVQTMVPAQRIQTLQDYVELVLLRDVIERHRLENVSAVRAFARLLLQSPARSFTVNKAHANLRSRGLKVAKDTLHALLDHLEDAYLVFSIPVFKKSEQARATNPRKLYAIDPGLAWAMSHVTATDVGARLENAVFLELRRRHGRLLQNQISYFRTESGREVDFVVGDVFEHRASRLIQASVSLADPVTRERKVRALVDAMREAGVAQGEIVTLYEEETIETDGGSIRVMPAWRWMLQAGP